MLLYPFLAISPLPLVPIPSGQDLFCHPVVLVLMIPYEVWSVVAWIRASHLVDYQLTNSPNSKK
jgi:hypothetical protein